MSKPEQNININANINILKKRPNEDLQIELNSLFAKGMAGDAKSYGLFLEKITPIVRAIAYKKISNHDVEDTVQDILISIHKARHTFDGERPIIPWVFAIAKFRINDALRKIYANHQDQNNFLEIDEAIDLLEAADHDKHTHDLAKNQAPCIEEILETISERERSILSMMYIEEYTAKETGLNLNMNESAVKVAAHRAIKKIRGVFGL